MTDPTKGTQIERVKAKLDRDGFITRNECVRQYPAILRLSARIQDLEAQGYEFEPEDTGRDYIYRLVKRPGEGLSDLEIAARAVRLFDAA
jgi:hypothetical protein